MWTQEGKERVRGIETVALTHTLPRAEQTAIGKLLYRIGSPVWHSVMTERGGMGAGRGRKGIYVHTELIHCIVPQKLTQHCKSIIRQ